MTPTTRPPEDVQETAWNTPSDRVRVAQIARKAALQTPGVVDLDSGTAGAFATVGGGIRIAGVTSAAAPEGGYDVVLRLVCEVVTLQPLAERVRLAVQTAARREQLELASVTIEIVDVREFEAA